MKRMNFSLRKRRALKVAAALGADALLITHLPDIRYLCGFTGSAGALALSHAGTRLFTDGRYREQADSEAAGTKVVIDSRPASTGATVWLRESSERCLFDAAQVTVAELERLRAALKPRDRKGFLLAGTGVLSRLREVKDAAEIEAMRAAAGLGCRLFEKVLSSIAPGEREAEIAFRLEQEARRGGAEGMSFETIVASGARSALPHGRASPAKLPRNGFVTLDFGVVLDGYCSDMTRTVHLGRPKPEARSVYDFVLEAQLAAITTVRAGVSAATIDEAARSVLRRAGLEKYFIHSTGHGLGLEIHEGPRIAAKATARLEAGMVITIEPGVYLPGRFGVRIEDTVLVTKTGGEMLTPTTKALIEL